MQLLEKDCPPMQQHRLFVSQTNTHTVLLLHCVLTLTYTGTVASQSHVPDHLILSGSFRPVISMYNVNSCWGKTCLISAYFHYSVW